MFYHTLSFDYNADGVRIKKSNSDYVDEQWVNDTHNYVLDGSKIIKETIERKVSSTITGTDVLYYYYDTAGSVAGFEYNGTPYYYQKNLQGDIIRICNALGNTVVEYTYDAWGKVLSVTGTLASTVGQINPFRYRGYYYDSETGFYYLQTRYYDLEVGRFLNADGYVGANGDILGYNMFAYCSNNPVMGYDPSGEWSWASIFSAALAITAIVAITVAVVAATVVTCGTTAPALATAGVVIVSNTATTTLTSVAITSTCVAATCAAAAATIELIDSTVEYAKSDYDPDPYKRPNQKKQGRENKNKARKKKDWEPRNNCRDRMPRKPKHHTPGDDHRKY
ncbi:MAG: RHS repeat-associated core domain-containing protein [Clostridia bacterium]|nr:RHS repeat-associated core domain-containing protein [Clostridia bacterium]